jgi:hypothetical protein
MQRKRTIILILTAFLYAPIPIFGETIMLKSGQKLEGKIIEKTDKYVKIDFYNVVLTYYVDEIASIGEKPDAPTKTTPPIPVSSGRKEAQDIFKEISSATVYITTKTMTGEEYLGSGFIVDSSGVIATNFHVVESAEQINIKLKDGTIYPVSSIIHYDINRDLCLLKVETRNLPSLPLGDSDSLQIGEKIYCIGNPLGLEYSFSDGMLSGIRDLRGLKYLQFTAPISPGNSGGPIVDMQGKVIGMTTFEILGGQNLNFALAVNEIKPFIKITPKLTLSEFIKKLNAGIDYLTEEDLKASSYSSDPLLGNYSITYAQVPVSKASYKGMINIAKKKDAYRILWKFPGSTLPHLGVGIVVDNVLCASWGIGRYCGVAVYKVKGGRLKGKWADSSSFLIGTEDLEGPPGLRGEYKVINSFAPQANQGYSGTVLIEKYGEVYLLNWIVNTGSNRGIGILLGDLLIVSWGSSEQDMGVVAYKIEGKELSGVWAAPTGEGIGIEDLSKIP